MDSAAHRAGLGSCGLKIPANASARRWNAGGSHRRPHPRNLMNTATALKRRVVRFTTPLHAELCEQELDASQLEPQQMLVETDYSVVSAGTELSIYRGIEAWCQPPCDVGYGSVGRVVKSGSAAAFAPGARGFSYGNPADLNNLDPPLPLPRGVGGRV